MITLRRPTITRQPLLLALACCGLLSTWNASAAALFVVREPWVRVDTTNTSQASAFMQLTSTGGAVLAGVRSAAAQEIELRSGMPPRDRRVERLALTAGKIVALSPAGPRVALTGLRTPLHLGDRVPITLTIDNADGTRQEIDVQAEVRLHSPLEDHQHHHAH